MKSSVLVEKMLDIAQNYSTLYILGCIGAPICKENVERYKKNQSASRQAKIEAACDTTPLTFGFDCVCLIKTVLFWGWNGDPTTGYNAYGGAKYDSQTDYSIAQLLSKCQNVSDDFNNILPGEFLYYSDGHCGLYVGNGLAVEATAAWENKGGDKVCISAVRNIGTKAGYNSRTWVKHGMLPTVDYSEDSKYVPVYNCNISYKNKAVASVKATENFQIRYKNKIVAEFSGNSGRKILKVQGRTMSDDIWINNLRLKVKGKTMSKDIILDFT